MQALQAIAGAVTVLRSFLLFRIRSALCGCRSVLLCCGRFGCLAFGLHYATAACRLPTELVNQATEICQHEGRCPLYQIDAHNVVPVWLASDKQEVRKMTRSALTINWTVTLNLLLNIVRNVRKMKERKFPSACLPSRKHESLRSPRVVGDSIEPAPFG